MAYRTLVYVHSALNRRRTNQRRYAMYSYCTVLNRRINTLNSIDYSRVSSTRTLGGGVARRPLFEVRADTRHARVERKNAIVPVRAAAAGRRAFIGGGLADVRDGELGGSPGMVDERRVVVVVVQGHRQAYTVGNSLVNYVPQQISA